MRGPPSIASWRYGKNVIKISMTQAPKKPGLATKVSTRSLPIFQMIIFSCDEDLGGEIRTGETSIQTTMGRPILLKFIDPSQKSVPSETAHLKPREKDPPSLIA